MAESDVEDNEEVSFLDLQKNLKTLSQKELRALANVLIDAYYGMVSERDTLAAELDQSEGVRSSLTDENIRLNEELNELVKENLSLDENIMKCTESENKREKSLTQIQTELEMGKSPNRMRWESGRLFSIQSEPDEGSGEHMSSTDQVFQVDGVNTQSIDQEPGTPSESSEDEH
ncbi:hypothetical protein HAX54_012608 [Datura stramonium]|uniref:Uncharacterized protein n=1 Tax=Datura stramonium TaxID=4076 RepID=A0ABS8TMX2_DATST|nr:hypothetical protein [Datura stramonium]